MTKEKQLLDITNAEYHSDNGYYSSSQLKDALGDPFTFYQKYILKSVTNTKRKPAFDIGTAFHVRILEPQNYKKEVVHFNSVRRGAVWEAFDIDNKDKAILSKLQQVTVDTLVKSVTDYKLAEPYMTGGVAEKSIFGRIEDLRVKCRADYLNAEGGYLMDLKSTTGELTKENIKKTIAKRDYDLSAALYLDLFKQVHPELEKFIFIFSSKDYPSCKVVEASDKMIENGRRKYTKAIKKIKEFRERNWEFKQEIMVLDPIHYDVLPGELEEF